MTSAGKKMDIGRILYVLNSSNKAGGAVTGLLQLIRALPRDRYRAYLVVPAQPNDEELNLFNSLFDDIAVVLMGGNWVKEMSRPFYRRHLSELGMNCRTLFHLRPQRQLRHLIRKWNINLVYTGSALVLESAIAAKLAGLPHIWHIKERIGKNCNSQFYLPDHLLISLISALSSRIVVMSDYIAEPFVKHGKTAKVIKIHDGVELNEFEQAGDGRQLREQLGVDENEFLVGHVASITARWKKPELFIQIAAILKRKLANVRFVHFGHIPPINNHHRRRYDTLCQLVGRLGLNDSFIWADACSNIPEMMKSLDLLVHPTNVEPFGRVAIEAMAARVPVVGPDQGGIAESVVNEKTGLLVPADKPEAFANAAMRILKDDNLRRQMGEVGVEHVRKHFSTQQHVRRMIEVFESVLQ